MTNNTFPPSHPLQRVNPLLSALDWTPQRFVRHLAPLNVSAVLAAGGQGYVLEAGPVVLKVPSAPSPFAARIEQTFDALVDEHDFLRAHAGPGLVCVVDFCEDSALPYLVLERLGESFEDRCERMDEVPLSLAFDFMADIAETLVRVHAAGDVHNDINPANALWDGERWTLIDPSSAEWMNDDFNDEREEGPIKDVRALARSTAYVVFDDLEMPDEPWSDDDDYERAWDFLRRCTQAKTPNARTVAARARAFARTFEGKGD